MFLEYDESVTFRLVSRHPLVSTTLRAAEKGQQERGAGSGVAVGPSDLGKSTVLGGDGECYHRSGKSHFGSTSQNANVSKGK